MAEKNYPRLNSEQAELVVQHVKRLLGPELVGMLDKAGIDPNHMVRFQYISNLCRTTREEKHISLKQASRELKIPQYRLREIEGGNVKSILPDVLEKYVDYLGLAGVFHNWLKENGDIYKSIQENRDK